MSLLVSFLSIFSITLILVFILFLFKKQPKELSDKILISIFILLFFLLLLYYSSINEIIWLVYISVLPFIIFEGYIAPTLYIYIKSLFENPKGLIKRNLIHYISIPIQIILFILAINISNGILFDVYSIFSTVYCLSYCYFSLRKLNFYEQKIKHLISSQGKYDFRWVKYLILGFIIIQIISLILIFPAKLDLVSVKVDLFIIVAMLCSLITFLSYYGLTQTKILLPDFLIGQDNSPITLEKNKAFNQASSSLLNAEEVKEINVRLQIVFEEQKPHLDPNLTLHKLAKMSGFSPKKISVFLNQYKHQKFFDYINTRRVDVVKEKMLLSEFENYTLISIALDSGFNSKTTFNRIFKKTTGYSPSVYKEMLKDKKHK